MKTSNKVKRNINIEDEEFDLSKIVIEKNIPITSYNRPRGYYAEIVERMAIGDSIMVPNEAIARAIFIAPR